MKPHASSLEALIAQLDGDVEKGLPAQRVAERQQRIGFNELAESPRPSFWRRFLGQFRGLVIGILIVAAFVSVALGEWADAMAILGIVLLNGLLGFFQEERAERGLAALRRMAAPMARVIRGGDRQSVPARELVPGDLVEIEAGDHIPADARLVRSFALRVQEAALTGESVSVDKDAQAATREDAPLAERRNMLYLGTVATAGKASAMVVATGMTTELGRIAGMLQRDTSEPTPLQRRLHELGRVLAVACLIIVAGIFGMQMLRGGDLIEVFLSAVSLAVAAVPEGLPAVVTVGLAIGLQRMVKRNALIRRLPSVETLGAVTVICSDKTGTLTRNEMTVREIVAGDARYLVTGAGYSPNGQFLKLRAGADVSAPSAAGAPVDPAEDAVLLQALTIGARCNNARLVSLDETWQVVGDPTDGALLVAALKARIDPQGAGERVVLEVPFDSERKMMSVVTQRPDGQAVVYSKGAAEAILSRCTGELAAGGVVPLAEARREKLMHVGGQMASRALRVLALAYRPLDSVDSGRHEADLIFAGLAGMLDPPREEAKAAVQTCHAAGIRPVMITGDHPATALAIARELDIAGPGARVMTGLDLDAVPDDRLVAEVDRIAVYARVSAEHKLRVIRAWKARGQVVAMTGDGVNDAPAVKAADIGIAMGIAGTDVTKEASDMVLMDDNFASIVSAVEEGRCIYDNIQKVLRYLLSCNCGEIVLMLATGLLGWPAPLIPVQLLWINLVTDGLPALALSLEPPEPGIMRRRPRSPKDSMLSARTGLTILWQGVLIGLTTLTAFAVVYLADPAQVGRARTTAFCVLVYSELLRVLAARSQRLTLFQLGLRSNPHVLGAIAVAAMFQFSVVSLPFAQPVFETVMHFAWEWVVILTLSLIPVTVIEVVKLLRIRAGRRSD